MRKLLILSFTLSSVFGFSQKPQDEYALVKVEVVKVSEKQGEIFNLPNLGLKESIEVGFRTSNAKLIAKYFAANVDVSLLDKENLYSKPQAEQVLKTFFLENTPVKFTIIHNGKSAKNQYFIGALISKKGNFRITLNIKKVSNKEVISHLTIES